MRVPRSVQQLASRSLHEAWLAKCSWLTERKGAGVFGLTKKWLEHNGLFVPFAVDEPDWGIQSSIVALGYSDNSESMLACYARLKSKFPYQCTEPYTTCAVLVGRTGKKQPWKKQ
jgi:hypothetical protein